MPSVELKEPAAAKTTTDAQDGRTVTAVAQEEPADAKSVTIAQLIGAVLFAVGSAFFVWMAWADDWILPWRIGCGLWIGGCVRATGAAGDTPDAGGCSLDSVERPRAAA